MQYDKVKWTTHSAALSFMKFSDACAGYVRAPVLGFVNKIHDIYMAVSAAAGERYS